MQDPLAKRNTIERNLNRSKAESNTSERDHSRSSRSQKASSVTVSMRGLGMHLLCDQPGEQRVRKSVREEVWKSDHSKEKQQKQTDER